MVKRHALHGGKARYMPAATVWGGNVPAKQAQKMEVCRQRDNK